MLLDESADCELVIGIYHRPEETNRNCLDAPILRLLQHVPNLRLIDCLYHSAFRVDPFADLERERPRYVRLWILRPEIERAPLSTFPKDKSVGEALRAEEGRARRRLRDDGVGRV